MLLLFSITLVSNRHILKHNINTHASQFSWFVLRWISLIFRPQINRNFLYLDYRNYFCYDSNLITISTILTNKLCKNNLFPNKMWFLFMYFGVKYDRLLSCEINPIWNKMYFFVKAQLHFQHSSFPTTVPLKAAKYSHKHTEATSDVNLSLQLCRPIKLYLYSIPIL